MRIAYFLSAFPNTSETFVLHQIAGAVQEGHAVEIHAYHVAGHIEHPLLEAYNLLDHVQYRPSVPENKLLRLFKACFLMLGLFFMDTRNCVALFSLLKWGKTSEWLELFFLAWSLRGGKGYDVIHAHFGPNGLMAVRLRQAGFLQGKIVTSFHGFDANVVPNLLGKDYYQSLFAKGDAFVVSSEFIQKKLLALGLKCALNSFLFLRRLVFTFLRASKCACIGSMASPFSTRFQLPPVASKVSV
ncbi:MAG: hypothetical protein COB41_10245, partial [Proteobacteria bacterium]